MNKLVMPSSGLQTLSRTLTVKRIRITFWQRFLRRLLGAMYFQKANYPSAEVLGSLESLRKFCRSELDGSRPDEERTGLEWVWRDPVLHRKKQGTYF